MSARKLFIAFSLMFAGTSVASDIAFADSLTVMNLNGTGPGSLRATITTANSSPDPNTITFAPSLRGVIALETPLVITNSVTIIGPGASRIRLSGQGLTRVLEVSGVENESTIEGLGFESGEASDDGGCIVLVDADVTLSNVTVRNCHSSGNGGGIAAYGVEGVGSLVLENFALKSNVATNGGGLFVEGGFGLTATDGQISNNTGQDGGGVALLSPQAHTFERVLFQSNTGFSAGAMYIGLMGPGGPTTLTDTTFIGNSGFTSGAIYTEFASTDSGGAGLVITNSTMIYNRADNGVGALRFVGGSMNQLTMRFSTVMYNLSSGVGTGGVYAEGPAVISHSVITENRGIFGETVDDIDVGYLQTLLIDHSLLGEDAASDLTDPNLDQWTSSHVGVDHHLTLYATTDDLPIMMPSIDSPVINGGETSLAGAPLADARGVPRLAGTRYDIGAVEWQAPLKPQNVTSVAGVRSITVKWSQPSENGDSEITNYRVFRKTGSRWLRVGTTGPSGRSLLIGGLATGRAYTFRVVAINVAGLGEPSRTTTSVAR